MMKAAILALIVGALLNTGTVNGRAWSMGSVAAIVIMGLYLKISMDKRFEELKACLKDGDIPPEIEEASLHTPENTNEK